MSKKQLLNESTGAFKTLVGSAKDSLGNFYDIVKARFKGVFRSFVYWARVHFPLTPFRSMESYRNMARNYDQDMNRIYGELDSAMSRMSLSNGTLMMMNPTAGIVSLLADASVGYNTGDLGDWFQDLGLRDIIFDRNSVTNFEGAFGYLDESNPDALKERFAKITGVAYESGRGKYFDSIFGSIQRLFLLDLKKDSYTRSGNILLEVDEKQSLDEMKKELFLKHMEIIGLFEMFENIAEKFTQRKKEYVAELMETVEEANRIGSAILDSNTPRDFQENVKPLVVASKSKITKKLDIDGLVKMAEDEYKKLKQNKKSYNEVAKKIGKGLEGTELDEKILEHIFTAARSDFANVIGESMKSTYDELKQIITGNLNKSQQKDIQKTENGKAYLDWMNKTMKKLDDSLTKSESLQK